MMKKTKRIDPIITTLPCGNQLQIRMAGREDIPRLYEMVDKQSGHKDRGYFERQLSRQKKEEREVLIARFSQKDAAYCILNWFPKYAYYKVLGIPEIQDLNVLPAFRRRGIATALIDHCEGRARDIGRDKIGISVGVQGSYGPAQVLYAKRGYVPDGNGVTYDRRQLAFGEMRPLDDQLCLMMVKTLKNDD